MDLVFIYLLRKLHFYLFTIFQLLIIMLNVDIDLNNALFKIIVIVVIINLRRSQRHNFQITS